MKEEIAAWRKEMCLDMIVKPSDDPLKSAVQFEPIDFDAIHPKEMDRHLMVLTNYYSYLQSQLGTISARMSYIEEQLNLKVNIKAQRFGASHAAERRALAINKDVELKKLDDELSKERVKFNMLNPVIVGVKNKIDSMKKIYDRKIRDRNGT